MWQRLFTFLSKHKVVGAVICLYILGLGLRFAHLNQALWAFSGYDDSRDSLVAQHFVEHGQFLWRGPLVASGFGWLLNSPAYYYLLAALWFIFRSPIGLLAGWVLLTSLVIPIAYWTGKKTYDAATGLILALLVTVHPLFLQYSQEMFQPHLMPVLMLVIYGALLSVIEKNTLRRLLWLIAAVSIPIHFHYSILLTAPVLLFWLGKKWYEHITLFPAYTNVLLPLGTASIGFLLWIGFTYNWYPFDQAYFFIFNFENIATRQTSGIASLGLTLYTLGEILVPYWPDWARWTLIGILGILASLMGIFLVRSTTRQSYFKQVLAVIFSLASCVLLVPFFGAEVTTYYLVSIMPFLFMIMALAFRFAFKRSWLGGVLILTPFLVLWWNGVERWYDHLPRVPLFDETKLISQRLAEDIGSNPTQFALAGLGTDNKNIFDYWPTSAYWYHLEMIYNTPLVALTRYGVNHSPRVGNPTVIYMICDHRVKPELISLRCIHRFESSRDYLVTPPIELYHSDRFTVWRYDVQPDTKGTYFTLNEVYTDFPDY